MRRTTGPTSNARDPLTEDDESPIRVLIMQSQDYFGPDSRIQAELAAELDRRVVEVHVACNAGTRSRPSAALAAMRQVPDIALRPTRFGPTKTMQSRLTVLRDLVIQGPAAVMSLAGLVIYCRRHRIEIVHGTEKPRDSFYGFLLSRVVGARCIIHVHVKAERWIRGVTRWAMGRTDALLAISEFVAQSLRDMGYRPERIHTALNGLDMRDWAPEDHDGARVRREFGIAEDTPVLAIVARLFVWKGHLELLEALAVVAKQRPDVRLLVVGIDDPRAAPGRQSLSAEMHTLIERHGLQDNVVFTGFRSDIGDLMAACDIYSMPSFEEPFGMVYVEAMSLERPVVGLDNGGTREIVVHGVTGLLSDVGDIDGLAANIMRLIEDPELRRKMGAAGRRRALEHFSPAAMARPVEALYRQLARRRVEVAEVAGERS